MEQLWHRLWTLAPKVDDVIRRDLLIQSSKAALRTNEMALGMLVVLFATLHDTGVERGLLTWTGLLLANTVLFQVAIRWQVRRLRLATGSVRTHQVIVSGIFLICGLVWGSLALLVLPEHGGSRNQAVVCAMVVIAAASNIAFASAAPGPFLAFHLASTLLAGVGLLLAGAVALALLIGFALIAALPLQRDLYLQISGAKLTARQNHLLAEELRGERAAVEQTNLRLVEANVELSHRATRDPLTGLANRALFSEHLSSTLARSRQTGRSLSVIYFDLDRFKLINDTLGHAAGDELLRQVGPRITQMLRESDVLARLGGDEFVVLTVNAEHPAGAATVAEAVAERIRAGFEVPFSIAERTLRVTPSLGVAHDDGHSTGEQLVANADAALYRAKELGRNRVATFDSSLRSSMRARVQDGDVLRALFDGEGDVEARFEPVLDLSSGLLVAVETAISLRTPDGPGLTPDELRHLAERTGMTALLDEELLRQGGRFLAEDGELGTRAGDGTRTAGGTGAAGRAGLRVFARMGRADVGFEDLRRFLAAELVGGALLGDGGGLGILIGERQIVSDPRIAADRIQAIRDLGVAVLLDGFGRGVSSMALLAALPVDGVRLDPELSPRLAPPGLASTGVVPSGLASNGVAPGGMGPSERRAMLAGIVELARYRGLSVTATGVRHEDELDLLRQAGVGRAQGTAVGVAHAFK